jgi:hypothetical protein
VSCERDSLFSGFAEDVAAFVEHRSDAIPPADE